MKYFLSIIVICISFFSSAQDISEDALALALEDIETFSEKFYTPGSEAIIYAMSSGWFNSAKAKEAWKLDIGLVGNVTLANSDSRSFLFDEADYNSTRLVSGQTQQNVSTILGENNPNISVFLSVDNPNGGDDIDIELRLPNGITKTVNFMPTAFIQASLGLGKGFEIKARYLPNVTYKDVEAQFIGFGIQNEITKWIKTSENFPLHISAFVGYNNFEGFYGFTESDKIDDLDGRSIAKSESWLFSGIVSTKFEKLNFYSSIGFISGVAETTTSMTGDYTIERQSGDINANIDIEPYAINTSVNGARLTFGANLTLGSFNVFSDFSLQEFSTASIGVSYRIN
jgi:hypothetical protein